METLFLSIFQTFLPVIVFFSCSGNAVLKRILHSGYWKLIFSLVELIFSHFSDVPSSETYFSSSGNVVLNESSNRYGEDVSSALWKTFSLIQYFFLQVETVTEISGNPFLGGKTFLSNGNCFLLFRASFLQVKTVTETSWNKQSVLSLKWPFLISNTT